MIRKTFFEIFDNVWPMLLIFSVVVISIRLAYVYENHIKLVIYKELLSLLFILYILCLFYVVTFQDVSWSTSNFIPFKEMFRYDIGSRLFFKNVFGNMLMFLPYGFFITEFIKTKKPLLILILVSITSVTIEIIQLAIGRVFDIDDILLNILGGITGYLLYRFLYNIREKLPNWLKNELFYNILFLVFIGLIMLYLAGIISIGW